jgi:hypothetical protein
MGSMQPNFFLLVLVSCESILQATIAMFLCLALSALVPTIEYVFILRKDSHTSRAYPASIWAGCAMTLFLGLAAYKTLHPMLLGAHAALTSIAGSAMLILYTMVYFDADIRCRVSQYALQGCGQCSCAASSSCTTVRPPACQRVHDCLDRKGCKAQSIPVI